jgi:hypothetical protein
MINRILTRVALCLWWMNWVSVMTWKMERTRKPVMRENLRKMIEQGDKMMSNNNSIS